MMMNKRQTPIKLLTILTVALLGSCQIFFESDMKASQNNAIQFKQKRADYCEGKNDFQILSDSKKNNETFNRFLAILKQKKVRLNSYEKAALLALMQMNARPEISAPQSKLFFSIIQKGEIQHYNFFSLEADISPYFKGLDFLLIQNKYSRSLKELIQIYQEHYPEVYVSYNFEQFLKANSGQIRRHESFTSYYIRGNDTLKEDEKIDKFNLLKHYQKTKNLTQVKPAKLLDYRAKNKEQFKCNFDLSLYHNDKKFVSQNNLSDNSFGIIDGEISVLFSSFLASNEVTPYKGSPFFSGLSNSRSSMICEVNDLKDPNKFLIINVRGLKDPGQILYKITKKNITGKQNPTELLKLLNSPRVLILDNPERALVESEDMAESELSKLREMRVPLYTQDSIGSTTGLFIHNFHKTFLVDQRGESRIWCQDNYINNGNNGL